MQSWWFQQNDLFRMFYYWQCVLNRIHIDIHQLLASFTLNPKQRKYVDPPGHIAKYIGFNYDSVEHLCWNYQKFQTRQNPIERFGNDQCNFFRMLNPKLFVIPHGDPAYAMYWGHFRIPENKPSTPKANQNTTDQRKVGVCQLPRRSSPSSISLKRFQ